MQVLEFLQVSGNLLLLNLLLQITALSALALLIAGRFKHNPVARYAVLFPALLSLVVLVGASVTLRVNDGPLLRLSLPQAATSTMGATADFLVENAVLSELDVAPFSLDEAGAATVSYESISTSSWSAVSSLPVYLLFILVWLAGVMVATVGLLRSFHHIDSLSRRSAPLNPADQERLQCTLNSLPSHYANMKIRVSSKIASPMLAGLIKPVLLIPRRFISELEASELRGIILHEFAHYQRNDALANFLQKIVVGLFWFHPFVHLMDRQIARAREEICDNHVLDREQAVNYGETLLRVSTLRTESDQTNGSQGLALGIFGGEWRLENRIGDLLSEQRQRILHLPGWARILQPGMYLLASLSLAACQVGAAGLNERPTVSIPAESSNSSVVAGDPVPGTGFDPSQQEARLLADNAELQREMQEVDSQARAANEEIRRRQQELERQVRQLEQEVRQRQQEVEQQASQVEQDIRARQEDLANQQRLLEQEARQRQEEIQQQRRYLEEQLQQTQQNLEQRRRALQQQLEQRRQDDSGDPPDAAAPAAGEPDSDTGTPRYLQAQSTQPTQSRPPPQARTSDTLSEEVMEAIVAIQELMSPEDSNVDPDLTAAKELLDSLRAVRFETMNDFERSTLLNFYTNYYLTLDDYDGAIDSFEEILQLATLRDSTRLRTLRSLGQLYGAEEQWQPSIDNYSLWRELSEIEDDIVYRGLSHGHYQLEQFEPALTYWQDYMAMQQDQGETLDRDDYAFLNGLYFDLQRFDQALELTKEMILLFNSPTDWNNLRAIYRNLDAQEEAARAEAQLLGALTRQGPEISQATVSPTDGDYLPWVAIAPQYPTRAAQQAIEGWCLVSFTVDPQGNVLDDSISVVDADPPDIFNRSSIRAAEQFKFHPRVENGQAVSVPGVQYLFRYALEAEEDV